MTSTGPERRPKSVWALRYLSAAIREPPVTPLLRSTARHRPEPCRSPLLTSAGSSTTFRLSKLGRRLRNVAAPGASEALINTETLPHATPRASKCSNHLTCPRPYRAVTSVLHVCRSQTPCPCNFPSTLSRSSVSMLFVTCNNPSQNAHLP